MSTDDEQTRIQAGLDRKSGFMKNSAGEVPGSGGRSGADLNIPERKNWTWSFSKNKGVARTNLPPASRENTR